MMIKRLKTMLGMMAVSAIGSALLLMLLLDDWRHHRPDPPPDAWPDL